LARRAFRFNTEEELADGIELAFKEDGIVYEREVRLGERDRVDFMVGALAIEVKIKGGISPLTRQVARYVKHERVEAIMVCTSSRQYASLLPPAIGGKQVAAFVFDRAFA
jgi:hypothetical protein